MARSWVGWALVTDSESTAVASLGSFYQLARTVAYAIASALSATLLVLAVPRGHTLPAGAGYSTAALASIAILVAALAVSLLFARPAANSGSRPPAPGRI